ncbi:hypothetical protein LUZ60_011239 [Juncus effusus]|nr:hypothetical protein LUZ60_011239 [Juncus effusus]
MATVEAAVAAAGGAVLLYLALICRLSQHDETDGIEEEEEEEETWPELPPANWMEVGAIAARTLMLACGETVMKWPIGDIAFGIKRQMRIQGNLQHEYTGENCVQLKGREALSLLTQLLRDFELCFYFSKKPFPDFLKFGNYDRDEHVLMHEPKARLMKPSFTLLRCPTAKSFLLIIRGATTATDRLTAASGAEVPFHHMVLREGKIVNLVLGHAHCGMLTAARWICQLAVPCLHEIVGKFPEYKLKIMGHSMGAGIAAILTLMLREREEFSSCTCISFAPAACMTWELAEAGKEFITSLVNKDDVVPSFCKVSTAKIRSEVMASSRRNNIRQNMQPSKLFDCLNLHLNNIKSHFASISISKPDYSLVHCNGSSLAEPLIRPTINGSDSPKSNGIIINGCSTHACSSYTSPPTQEVINPQKNQEKTEPQKTDSQQTEPEKTEAENRPDLTSGAQRQFYPPGRIFHMVVLENQEEENENKDTFGIYETHRGLYGKMRLAPNMVEHHYMPSYIDTLEVLIEKVGKDCTSNDLIDL